MYDSEVWTLSKIDEYTLPKLETKILRSIFGPVKENGVWKNRTNQELMKLYTETDIFQKSEKES
jgi:hypothetical protein